MIDQLFHYMNIGTDFLLLILLVFYFFYLRIKEKALNRKENKIDADYHKIVDNALSRERKIIEDTTIEADQILSGAKYVTDETKEAVSVTLQKMIEELEQDTSKTSREFIEYYLGTLRQLAQQSLGNFQNITRELENDLHKEVKEFEDTLLPGLEKEVENYRQARLRQVETSIDKIVQKVSTEVLNKTISLDDHERLVIETLEKAKAEEIFN